ncbi:hypothetical protein CHS0354_024197 [Potamilus streckersoni]|uniref:RBR-type E3 ubiquitin transferase n=1 Tax=Potamilus streckersoni TaxID=2493646 RepID=A0AAE0RY53_9BIVA|nr:hypothetical protein CHS0354_024197 [Potamilus streckersoni]
MPGNKFQIFLKGLESKTHTIDIDEDASIDDLFDDVSRVTGLKKDEMRVVYAAKQLQSEVNGTTMTLKDYGIGKHATLFVLLRLPGGWDNEEQQPKVLDDDVELTDDPDMITLDDDPESQRAKMPCGHAIGPESLTALCRSLLDAGRYEFRCPYKKETYCGQIWDYIIVRKLAVLTEKEQEYFETKLSENYLRKAMGIQDCPKCGSFCERRDNKNIRVTCILCSKGQRFPYDFCWYCLRPWLSAGARECGNPMCDGKDPRLKILKKACNKEIVGVKNCPSVRACPACGCLIEHERACKHMTCRCGTKFCFICLKVAVNGLYQCGSFNTKCEIAPIQEELPGCN